MKIIEYPYWIIRVKKLFYSKYIRDWCELPYIGHSKGCPMYGKRSKCPPESPYIEDIFDLNKALFIVYSEFNLENQAKKMRSKHPNWTNRQTRNCLYWQGKSRKQLKERIKTAQNLLNTDIFTTMPESAGVQMYRTCLYSGLKLEKIGLNMKINRHTALLGWRKNG